MLSEAFKLDGRVAVITGGAGFLGRQHAEAVAEAGGRVVVADLDGRAAEAAARELSARFGIQALGVETDVTDPTSVRALLKACRSRLGGADILVNNAAIDPKVRSSGAGREMTRLENFPLERWRSELEVGLTGAFLCSQAFGTEMARRRRGVILNIASDLAVIAPDQRLYRQKGLPESRQPVKPVTYSVLKTGLIGLTRYLATYWAERGVRVNALSPGGMRSEQPEAFVRRLSSLIPLGRMARLGEYKGAVLFLVSDASSYLTGANIVADGGRSVW